MTNRVGFIIYVINKHMHACTMHMHFIFCVYSKLTDVLSGCAALLILYSLTNLATTNNDF